MTRLRIHLMPETPKDGLLYQFHYKTKEGKDIYSDTKTKGSWVDSDGNRVE